jgi:putative transposase
MRKTFMYKLYKAKHNKRLHHQIHIGGVIHNHCIALHRRYYGRYGKYLPPHVLKAHIAKLKQRPKYAWWCQLGSQAIQDIIERIDKGYQRFFQNVKDRQAKKTTQRVGPPSFRKVRRAKSFTLKQAGWKLLSGNRLRLGSTVYKFAKSRDIHGTIKTVTIKRDPLGDLYVYFSCLVVPQPVARAMTGKSAGFDFGLTTYLTGSDSTARHAPQPLRKGLRELATANRHLSRTQKGSANRTRAKQHLARVHKRVANIRQAFHWELAHELCAQYDGIVLETLNLHGMKALWGRKVSDLGFGRFVQTLHHVAAKTGTVVHHINPWFPSTKLCAECGHLNDSITLRDRLWCCPCGAMHQRDQNAARNIFREGASSLGGGRVRPTLSATAVDPRIPVLEGGEYVNSTPRAHWAPWSTLASTWPCVAGRRYRKPFRYL